MITRGPLSLIESAPADAAGRPAPPLRSTNEGSFSVASPDGIISPEYDPRELEQAIEEVLHALDAQPVLNLPPGFAEIIGRLRQWEELDANWTRQGDLQTQAITALGAILRDIPREERNGPAVIERLAQTLPLECWWGWLRTAHRSNRTEKDVEGLAHRVILAHYLPVLATHPLWLGDWSAPERCSLLELMWGRWGRYQRDQPDAPPPQLIEDLLAWRQLITSSLHPHEIQTSPVLGRLPAGLDHIWNIPGAPWLVRDTQVLQPALLVMHTRGWLMRSLNADGPLGWTALSPYHRFELTEAVAKTLLQASRLLPYEELTGIRTMRPQEDPILESLRQAHQRLLGSLTPGRFGEALLSLAHPSFVAAEPIGAVQE